MVAERGLKSWTALSHVYRFSRPIPNGVCLLTVQLLRGVYTLSFPKQCLLCTMCLTKASPGSRVQTFFCSLSAPTKSSMLSVPTTFRSSSRISNKTPSFPRTL
jgi:hypothetical protein